ncbi:hypothetical protein M9458_051328, partial [Cirrhinus mrigala]
FEKEHRKLVCVLTTKADFRMCPAGLDTEIPFREELWEAENTNPRKRGGSEYSGSRIVLNVTLLQKEEHYSAQYERPEWDAPEQRRYNSQEKRNLVAREGIACSQKTLNLERSKECRLTSSHQGLLPGKPEP